VDKYFVLLINLADFLLSELVHLSNKLRYVGREQAISSCNSFFFFWINRRVQFPSLVGWFF